MFRTLGAELTDAPWTAAMEKFTASAARMTASTTSIFTGLLRIMREVALAALPHLEAGFAKLAAKLERITTPEGLRKIGPVVDKLIGHFKSWMDLMGSLGGVMVALGVAIAPLGKGLVESLAAAADKTAAWIRTAEGTAKVKQVFTDLSSLAGSVAKAIGTIIVGFVDLSATAAPAVKALGDHLARLGGALGTALGPVFKQLIATIKRFFDSLAPAVPFLENILLPIFVGVFKGILAALQPVITVIGFFAKVLGWIGTAAEPLKPIFEGLGTVIGFLFGGPILGAVGGILKGIGFGFGLLGKAVSLAGKVLSWIGGLVGKLLSGPLAGLKAIGGVIGGGFKALGGVAKGAWGGIKNEVGRSAQGAKNIAVGAFNGLKDKATSGWNRLKVSAEKLWNSGIGQTIRGAASKAKDGAGQAFTILKDRAVKDFGKVKDGAARIFGGLKDFIVNKVKAAGEGIGRLASGFFNVGVEIIKGLIRGVGRMAQAVINKVKNIVTGAKNAAKRLLGIGSPSKVFAGFGQAVGQGFIDGVEGMARPIARAVEDTMGARVQAAGTDLAASLTSGGAVVGARGLAAPAAAGGAPVTVERHYHIQTIGGAAAPDPDFLIAQLDKRISDEGV
jgi:phage-related protein